MGFARRDVGDQRALVVRPLADVDAQLLAQSGSPAIGQHGQVAFEAGVVIQRQVVAIAQRLHCADFRRAAPAHHFRVEPLPQALTADHWQRIDDLSSELENWEMLSPTATTERTELLDVLATEIDLRRRDDPLTVLRQLNSTLYSTFAYNAKSTRVDSPIDEALATRSGVCQDYSHIMLALVRNYLRIPCRYVSGYLYHLRADRSADGASHAWVEAMLPDLGWVGFDPTNNVLAGDRHIVVGIGRDYFDVPPTRGTFRGNASSELSVTVRVRHADDVLHEDDPLDEAQPAYVATQQELQEQYNRTLLELMQMQQQQ